MSVNIDQFKETYNFKKNYLPCPLKKLVFICVYVFIWCKHGQNDSLPVEPRPVQGNDPRELSDASNSIQSTQELTISIPSSVHKKAILTNTQFPRKDQNPSQLSLVKGILSNHILNHWSV